MTNKFSSKVYPNSKQQHSEDPQIYDHVWKYKPLQTYLPFNGQITYTPKRGKTMKGFETLSLIRHSSEEELKQSKIQILNKNYDSGANTKVDQVYIGQKSPKNENCSNKKNQKNKSYLPQPINLPTTQSSNNQYNNYFEKDSKNVKKPKFIQAVEKLNKIQKRSSNGSSGSERKKNYLKQTSSTQKSKDNIPNFLKSKVVSRVSMKLQGQAFTKERFKKIKKLGEGKFGSVFLVRQIQSNCILAMKMVKKSLILSNHLLQQFIRQIKIQAFLNHPNILKLYGFFYDQEYFYTIMQLGCDGQLYRYIQASRLITEQGTSYIVKALLSAVNHMHEKQIIHRDLKPENIVLVIGQVKICDFGWAVKMQEDQDNGLRSTFCGTPLYFSPQLLSGNKYDQKVDLWAIGILAYELHICETPFHIRDQRDLQKIIKEDVKYPKNCLVSPQFKDFINCILQKDPKIRPTSQQLLQMHFIKRYQELDTCDQFC